jgi:hypothetical protein
MGKTKKSKDGGCAARRDDCIYALKGGNTQEFWRYNPAADSWREFETIPQFGSTLKKKKVKAGGDMTSNGDFIYAFKGNKTLEFWQYVPGGVASDQSAVGRSGVQSYAPGIRHSSPVIQPGLVRSGAAELRLGNPETRWPSGPVKVSILDVTGRVLHSAFCNLPSAIVLPLPAGLYMVRLTAGNYTATQKLVIQR